MLEKFRREFFMSKEKPSRRFRKKVRKFWDFNTQRLKASLLEFRYLFSKFRSSKLWWPSLVILAIFASSVMVNFWTLIKDQGLVLIHGETPTDINFEPVITENSSFVSGKSLELLAKDLPQNEVQFSIIYEFEILKPGIYWVLVGGTPPGSVRPDSSWSWFSPYSISFDGGPFTHLTEDYLKGKFSDQMIATEYIPGGYYWTRLGMHDFEKGKHTVEIRVDERRQKDGLYALYLDAFLLAPKNWKPLRSFSHMSRYLFVKPARDVTLP